MQMPNMITPKDLLYIEDMMNWNLIMNKKINAFISLVESYGIKRIARTGLTAMSRGV